MAVDTEAKRWSMLQLASGPSSYPLLFNPDTSGLSAIERATVLKKYGGISWGLLISCAVSGTVDGATEAEIVAGGKTIILTLTNKLWELPGAAFNAIRQDILDGITSAQSEATVWNAEVRDKEVVTSVVRTSGLVVTITLSAAPAYDITADETITVTVPNSALFNGGGPVIATPTFGIVADVAVAEEAVGGGIGKRWKRKRRITIEGQVYTVDSPAEEARLIAEYRQRLLARLEVAQERGDEGQARKVRIAIRRAQTRQIKAEDRRAAWLDAIREEDDEILMMVLH